MKTGVLRPRIDDVSPSQLLDTAETVESRVVHNIEQQTTWNADKAKDRVVDDFSGLHFEGLEFRA